jgi:hypothetical protein
MNLIFFPLLCQYLHERSYHLDTYVIYNSNSIYNNHNNDNNHHFPDKKNHSHVLDFNHDQEYLELLVVFLFTTVFTVVLCSFKGVKYNFRENFQIQNQIQDLDIENRYITANGTHNVNNIQNVEGEIVPDDESRNSDQIVNGRIVSLH